MNDEEFIEILRRLVNERMDFVNPDCLVVCTGNFPPIDYKAIKNLPRFFPELKALQFIEEERPKRELSFLLFSNFGQVIYNNKSIMANIVP